MNIDNWVGIAPVVGRVCADSGDLHRRGRSGSRTGGNRPAQKSEREPEAPLGSFVGAMLGLLAFILAFTFGMTASRFDARRQLVLEESNAIGTTYLRAGLLPQTQGLEVRRLLREYADDPLECHAPRTSKRC